MMAKTTAATVFVLLALSGGAIAAPHELCAEGYPPGQEFNSSPTPIPFDRIPSCPVGLPGRPDLGVSEPF